MYARILIATDGSELSAKGLQHGLELAAGLKALVLVLTVTEPWMQGFDDAHVAKVDVQRALGDALQMTAEEAGDAEGFDAVVVGPFDGAEDVG